MNILLQRQLILTISVNERPPSAAAPDRLRNLSQADVTRMTLKNRLQTVHK